VVLSRGERVGECTRQSESPELLCAPLLDEQLLVVQAVAGDFEARSRVEIGCIAVPPGDALRSPRTIPDVGGIGIAVSSDSVRPLADTRDSW
jgi:hypothetical protein